MNNKLKMLAIQIQLKPDMDDIELLDRVDKIINTNNRLKYKIIDMAHERFNLLMELHNHLNKDGGQYPNVERLYWTCMCAWAKLMQPPAAHGPYVKAVPSTGGTRYEITYDHISYSSPYILTDTTA